MEYAQRTSKSFYLSRAEKAIYIENHLGVVNVSGGSDSVVVYYLLDKTVKVKNPTLSQSAYDLIILRPSSARRYSHMHN